MQQKLQKQQLQLQKTNKNILTFDMLQTDDSTDDESTTNKRQVPEWSKSKPAKYFHSS